MSVLTAINYYKTNVNDDEINMIYTLNKEYEELENRYNSLSNDFQRYKECQRNERQIIEDLRDKNEALIKIMCKEKWNKCSFQEFISWVIEICKDLGKNGKDSHDHS